MVNMFALRAFKAGHVFNIPEDRDIHFFKHGNAFDTVFNAQTLWCTNKYNTTNGHFLSHG